MVTRCTSQDNAFQMNCELSFLWAFLRWGESVFVTNIIYFNYLSHKNHILVLTKVLLGYSKPNFIDIYVLNQSNYHWIRWKVLWCFQLFWLLTQWTWNPHHFMNVSWREEKTYKNAHNPTQDTNVWCHYHNTWPLSLTSFNVKIHKEC